MKKSIDWRRRFWIVAVIILAASLIFGLGYLSGYSAKRTPIIIEKYSPN